MEPCHFASTRSPALTSTATVAHLIRNIEQLKNKDKLISQLEKDLGHQWVAAQLAALERDACEGGAPGSPTANSGWVPGSPSQPATPSALPKDSQEPTHFSWAPSSTPERGGVEDEWPTSTEGTPPCKSDLQKLKERNKELLGKCRGYLQRTKELTAQNRAYKDSSHKVLQENKKMQELLEHSKLRILKLSREVSDARAEQDDIENQSDVVQLLRKELMEDRKTISALKQACSEKDRRIELIQHRKKRRRLAVSDNKNMGMKETFFGYEEDANSMDSEASFSSLSQSTFSDEDIWDDVMSREETERNYQTLMLEHLQLQKSYVLLQKTTGNLQDPQREERTKCDLQNDLFEAQHKVEKLEKMMNEIGQGDFTSLGKERADNIAKNRDLQRKVERCEIEVNRLKTELNKANEKAEDLEFQLVEMENSHEYIQGQKSCEHERIEQPSSSTDSDTIAKCNEASEDQESLGSTLEEQISSMDQFRKDLAAVLKGKGKDAERTLSKYDKVAEDEQKRATALESMARELQMKVVSLQKERDDLQEQVTHKGGKQQSQKSKKGKDDGAAISAMTREKQENLELMAEVSRLIETQDRLLEERNHLQEEVGDWKTQFEYLKQQLDLATKSPGGLSHQSVHNPLQCRVDSTSDVNSSGGSTPPNLSPSSTLTRKHSKDRKSKPRSGDDPTETKRRKSSNYRKPEDDRNSVNPLKNFQGFEDINYETLCLKSTAQGLHSITDFHQMTDSRTEISETRQRLFELEKDLQHFKNENTTLKEQLNQSALEKSCEAEADQQILLDKLDNLEHEIGMLQRENTMLVDRLRQRHEDLNDSQEEINPKIVEMEEFCADLQDRLWTAESAERQAKEKLRLLEGGIDELEASEMLTRERYEDLLAREAETKKQTRELQNTCQDLKEIVLDKDIVEQALRDKVDFLQKAEAASVKRIDELEAVEKELRAELERLQQMDSDELSKSGRQRELNKIQELRHQMTFLETDNRALSARVAELEENEETLRENWQRVAEEDYKRMQGLEQKLKMLESQNAELKLNLKDAEECIVINTVSSVDNSLAAELAQSQRKSLSTAREYDGSIDAGSDAEPESLDTVDGTDSEAPDSGMKRQDSEKRKLRDKLHVLERQLSDVAEKKNTTIESLQEKIVDLKENEIKLSETISEMEMTERELKAKLALYESSEVTVEKMLKYQSKIEELRTSQESLLDQIESMENQEMTLQEKMQEMERTLRGKIVTLEVEMKGFKQKELKDAARIRELEKQEKELSEKTTQQAEKENGLYVKISSLMDESKGLKEELLSTKTQLAEKEDKVRKAKLLDVKFLEIEMEFSKKMNDLSTKLRHKEEELRQREVAHEEEVATLKEELAVKESECVDRESSLEKAFDNKEMEWHQKLTAIEESVKELTSERDDYDAQILDLTRANDELKNGQAEYDIVMMSLRKDTESLRKEVREKEAKLVLNEEKIEQEKSRFSGVQNKLVALEEELENEKKTVFELRKEIQSLHDDMKEKMKDSESAYIEKYKDIEKQKESLQSELNLKNEKLEKLSCEVESKSKHIRELEHECEKLKSKSTELQKEAKDLQKLSEQKSEKLSHLESTISAKELSFNSAKSSLESRCAQLETDIASTNTELQSKEAENVRLKEEISLKTKDSEGTISSLLTEKKFLESELQNKVMFLSTQLNKEISTRESEQSSVKQLEQEHVDLSSEIASLKSQLETSNRELFEKQSELENRQKECQDMSSKCTDLELKCQKLNDEYLQYKESSNCKHEEHQNLISVKDDFLENLRNDLNLAQNETKKLRNELSIKEEALAVSISEKDELFNKKQTEIDELLQETSYKDTIVQEHIQKSHSQMQQCKQEQESEVQNLKEELAGKELILEQHTAEKSEMGLQIEDLQSQIQTLELYLSEVNAKLDIKSQAFRKLQQETESLTEEYDISSEKVVNLQKELESKREEVSKASSDHSESLSVVSAKQEELEKTRTELNKCLEEIKIHKNVVEAKEKQVEAQNQTNKQLTVELEELSSQCQSKDHDLHQLEEKMTGVEFKLVEAENRYRELESRFASLEVQLDERFAESQKTEETLKKKEAECEDLKSVLLERENVKAELKICETRVQEYQEAIEDKTKIANQLETGLNERKAELEKCKLELHSFEDERSGLQNEILTLQESLKENNKVLNEMRSRNSSLESALEEKETFCRDSQNGLSSLEQQHQEARIECQTLRSKVTYFQQMHSHTQSMYEENEERIKEMEVSLDSSREELLQLQNQLSETEGAYNELIAKYDMSEDKFKSAQEVLESMQIARRTSEQILENLKSEKSALEAKCERLSVELEEKNTLCHKLQSETLNLEGKLHEKSTECETLLNDLGESKGKLEISETESTKLKSSLEFSLSSHDEKTTAIQNKCLKLEKDLESKAEQISALEKERDGLVLHVQKQNTSLESKLEEAKEELIFVQTEIRRLENSNQTLSSQSKEDQRILLANTEKLESVERVALAAKREKEDAVDKLKSFEERTKEYESEHASLHQDLEKLTQEFQNSKNLWENTYKEMKDKEKVMSSRIDELEGKEKELLEQVADIEATVIVPLETENQELKDELAMIRQEKDELASITVKRTEEENAEFENLKSLQKSHEEALYQKEEFEKKVDILSSDIARLETERKGLKKDIEEFKSSREDNLEKIEALEYELERLQSLEKQSSVVEEAETRLMDRVLDLEETERMLTLELNNLKNKETGVQASQTEEEISYQEMMEKLKYLQQKNEVLQDAESRYMDKIMELEESRESVRSEQVDIEFNSPQHTGGPSDSFESHGINGISQTTQTSVPYPDDLPNSAYMTANDKATPDADDQTTSFVTSVTLSRSHDLETDSSTNKVEELQEKVQILSKERDEKSQRVSYLEEKLELLQDSEAKLMEKLLESEENEDQAASSNSTETKKQIDTLAEENEYLAQTVENFKKLYKEEKEKNSDLNDRIMEDSNLSQELQQARLELKSTQQMVEDIQSEYEDQLSQRDQSEVYLKSLLQDSNERVQELDKLVEEMEVLRLENEKSKTNWIEREQALQGRVTEFTQHVETLETSLDTLKQEKFRLQDQISSSSQREKDLLGQVESLDKQLHDMQTVLENREQRDEESTISDSGLSTDFQKSRHDSSDKEVAPEPIDRSIVQEKFQSTATLRLSSSAPSSRKSSTNQSPNPSPTPVAPPRRGRSRPPSIDSISQEELVFLVEELQNKEAALRKRNRELEALVDTESVYRVKELEQKTQSLEQQLAQAESRQATTSTVVIQNRRSPYFYSEEDNDGGGDERQRRISGGSSSRLNRSFSPRFSSALSSSPVPTMLEKPEDVLHQRIRELENLDKHNKNQLSDLERDREVLHEIARKDKATIHDLNVKIRELQLSERSFKEQVNSLEVSENSLFTKCEDLEALKSKLEDRVHELEIHERRLRELVRKLKLDEERWLSKSGGFETAVAELSANEHQLKRLLQDTEMEKGGLSERAEYLEARIRELENVEATLIQRLKSYESNEISLQNRLVHLENSEAAAHSKASELDVMNTDLSQRLQKLVEENAMLAQHVSQLHGQIQELDRRLLTSRDSEMAYKQHVESLQKNESSLQKKVREYELREIDSQARVRELEQTQDILNDKLATLQRSENRLKFRVQELEGIGGQIPGDLTPSQRQKVPQKLEDCQKRIVALQEHVENLQLQLRETLKSTHKSLASKEEASQEISISQTEYSQLQTKSLLLEETLYQLEEVENVNSQLNETILQLRDGKGASGHEVEIEVLKRRLASYKTFVQKLKSSLSAGQATSLLDPELDSGSQGESLPTHNLHGLASERVLQSVRGISQGKADTSTNAVEGANRLESPQQDFITESKTTLSHSSQAVSLDIDGETEAASSKGEESHWKAIEARKPTKVAGSRGGARDATSGLAEDQNGPRKDDGQAGFARNILGEVEEVTFALHLPSESELSSHHFPTQNDTDSSSSDPVPPPRKGRARKAGVKNVNDNVINNNLHNGSNDSRDAGMSVDIDDNRPASSAASATNETFVSSKSLPLSANKNRISPSIEKLNQQAPLGRFAEDYLPSSAQEGVDSLDDDDAPPLPSSKPPDADDRSMSDGSVVESEKEHMEQERKNSLENSTSGMSIRERIAMIERQLQSDQLGSKSDGDEILYWKTQAAESMKQVDVLEKDNKYLKEDINRLEKELEEKRRFINLLEQWLSSLEDLLKNNTKQTDREMIENLQLDLTKLRNELKHVGYRSENAVLDPAALKTELEHRDREIVTKRNEIEYLNQQLKVSREECQSIEDMRRTALDSLRTLEKQAVDLQDKAKHLDESQAALQALKSKYDELDNYKNQAVNMIQPLQAKLERLAKKCQEKNALLKRLGEELRQTNYRPSSALDDLTRMEQTMDNEECSTDFPPFINGASVPRRPERGRKLPSRSSSMDELDLSYQHHSDNEMASIPVPQTSKGPPRYGHYVNDRPKSADPLDPMSRRYRGGTHAQPRSMFNKTDRSAGFGQVESGGSVGPGRTFGEFVAIADYDPSLFSQSGRRRLELELREGDHVVVMSPMDRSGYHEAEVKGRTGLVPANYLQPLHGGGHMPRHAALRSQETFILASNGRDPHVTAMPIPDPPRNLHVKACVGEKSVLLSWLPPRLDNRGTNKGVKVLGYMVYLDHQEYEQIPNAKSCEVVIEDLRPDKPSHMAVQCLCAGGFTSPKTELIFQGIAQMTVKRKNSSEKKQDISDETMDTDLSSVLNNAHYKRGHRRTMIALYDYNAEQQTPHDYTALELTFLAGDTIHVYGDPRPDGFYHGEIDGQRGLVPACFVEDLSKMTRPLQRFAMDTEKQATHA